MIENTSQPSRPCEAVVATNIALLKYWGKRDPGLQWPANNSLSLTLRNLASKTTAEVVRGQRDHSFCLNGVSMERQHPQGRKAFAQLDALALRFGNGGKLRVASVNNFPMGCGIASSASGLGALTLAAVSAWTGAGSLQELGDYGLDREQLAHLARLGSGSACRSFWGGLVAWDAGESASAQRVRPVFAADHWQLADTIVIVSAAEKAISSTAGHAAAWTSPLFAPRLAGLAERGKRMTAAYAAKDMPVLGALIEQEALEMHGVMMSAKPPAFYFAAATSSLLAWLREVRAQHGLELYFTLDAGANVHMIGPKAQHGRLHELLAVDFPELSYLSDDVGEGPSLSRI